MKFRACSPDRSMHSAPRQRTCMHRRLTIVFAPHVSALPPRDKRNRPESQFYSEVRISQLGSKPSKQTSSIWKKKSGRRPRWNGRLVETVESCVKICNTLTFAFRSTNEYEYEFGVAAIICMARHAHRPCLDFRFRGPITCIIARVNEIASYSGRR